MMERRSMSYMRCFISVFCVVALATSAQSAVITGRVLDRTGRGVPQAHVRAFHNVPLLEFPPPGTWDGLLADIYTDANGYFTLHTSGRGSLDYLLAEGHGYFAVVSSPMPTPVRIALRRKILTPEEHVQELLNRLHRNSKK